MAFMAVINGTPVYADKKLAGIQNDLVRFTDSSWCSVRTMTVENAGSTVLCVGEEALANIAPMTKTLSFEAILAVDIQKIRSKVSVELRDDDSVDKVDIVLTGPERLINCIDCRQFGNSLVVDGGKLKKSNRVNIMNSHAVTIDNGIGDAILGGIRSKLPKKSKAVGKKTGELPDMDVRIVIKVPKRIQLIVEIDGSRGLRIGDIDGMLFATIEGSGKIKAGKMSNVRVTSTGTGDCTIGSAESTLTVAVTGSGNVNVLGGAVNGLIVTNRGSGDVRFDGVANRAQLYTRGSGSIRVSQVKEKLSKSEHGTGKIEVIHDDTKPAAAN
jgi:hypothetical protein